MQDAAAEWRYALTLMTEAFRLGDNGRGEELLGHALDGGAPWDVVTATVARAMLDGRTASQGLADGSEAASA